MTARLGECLRRRGDVSEEQLARALAMQRKSRSRLGDVLIGNGFTDYRRLYRSLADHHALEYVDLLAAPPDASLLNEADAETYLRLRAIPWRREAGGITVAAAEPSEAIRHHFGAARIAVTSPFDIRKSVERAFAPALERESLLLLAKNDPSASARTLLSGLKRRTLTLAFLVLLEITLWLPLSTALTFVLACHIVYAMTMLFKCLTFAAGAKRAPALHQIMETPPPIEDSALPIYTILLPMFKEARTLPKTFASLDKLDYPRCKLDIKLVLESDDRETLAAAVALKPAYHFEIICLPPGEIRTKPKACNYALRFARGEYVTIYDADDEPDPLQLKKAVQAFRALPENVACLQARLNYFNFAENTLTRLFSLEYTGLFHFLLHGLERLGIPLPLGGTSNHIALSKLKELGEWDPYNVTEDADLGIRLAARGYETRMLDSYTMEESPIRLAAWLGQRSRWIKGYMQTWLVHMRRPRALWRQLGPLGFIGFQCFVGLSCLTFLSVPLMSMLSVVMMLGGTFPAWLLDTALVNLAIYVVSHWVMAIRCALLYEKNRPPMLAAALLFPLYFLLHSLASYKALWQLATAPFFWEKTAHGVSRRADILSFEQQSR